jgi:hypothetical protein
MGTELEARLIRLELIVRAWQPYITKIEGRITELEQQTRSSTGGGYGGGSSASGTFYIAPVVIAAGGSVAGQTVYYLLAGAATVITASGTVYNKMAVATVAGTGQTIIVGPNGDGTYLAISQSCPP